MNRIGRREKHPVPEGSPGESPGERAAGAAVAAALRRNRPLRAFLFALANAVSSAGGSVFLAGGWLRDVVDGKPGADVDVMVAGLSHRELGEALDAIPPGPAGIRKVVRAGRHFPVYRIAVLWSGRYVDVAAARVEGDPRGRHPFDSALADAARRDFTINSMLYELAPRGNRLLGELTDVFGGISDLAGRTIRCVGAAEDRFLEDPVRTLRAIRMKNERKGYAIDPATWSALRREGPGRIAGVPADRCAGELVRSLQADPAGTLDDLRRSGILRVLLPELSRARSGADRARCRYASLARAVSGRVPAAILLAGLLLDLPPEKAEGAARRLRFPNVRKAVSAASDIRSLLDPRGTRHPLARTEAILARQDDVLPFIALYRAAAACRGVRPRDLERFLARCAKAPRLIDGIDLAAVRMPEGPGREEALLAVREATLSGKVKSRKSALQLVRSLACNYSRRRFIK